MYSYNPGALIASSILCVPVSVTLPFVTMIFLFVSLSIIVPKATTYGVNVLLVRSKELLISDISIFTLPLLPIMSSALASLPSK